MILERHSWESQIIENNLYLSLYMGVKLYLIQIIHWNVTLVTQTVLDKWRKSFFTSSTFRASSSWPRDCSEIISLISYCKLSFRYCDRKWWTIPSKIARVISQKSFSSSSFLTKGTWPYSREQTRWSLLQ